LIAFS
jgi:hypothetical protein